jgi:hypothetical protein
MGRGKGQCATIVRHWHKPSPATFRALPTYMSIKKKNICDMATTPPMKNPTAMELWNFRIIMVPPILKANNIKADHMEVKASLRPRVDMTAHDMSAKIPVKLRMEYLEDAKRSKSRRCAGQMICPGKEELLETKQR